MLRLEIQTQCWRMITDEATGGGRDDRYDTSTEHRNSGK